MMAARSARGSAAALSVNPQDSLQKEETMKNRTTVALAIIVGFGLGAATVGVIHGQAKPPVYVVAEIDISNMDAYMKEFQPKAAPLVQKYGGRVIAASANVTALDGQRPSRVAVQQWDSMEKVKAWFGSPEYKEIRKIGEKYAKFRVYAVEGRPQ
jgi:uncharacterized protein (DUF1330 family)